jgi:O-antigen/teichoic acid export membrane protein
VLLTATTVFASSFSGSYLIHNSLRQKIVISSYLSLTFNIVFSLLVIGAVLLKQGISYLFLSYALCYLSYSVLNSWLLKKELSLKVYPKKWLIILKQSLVFVAIGFLASFYSKVDIFILKKFFDNQTLGVYSAGLKFLDALLIIAGSYNIIVIPLMRKLAKNPRQLKTKIIKDMVFLFAFGVLVATSFYLTAPFLLSLVLKSNFGPSLQVARIISFAIIPILLTSVFYNALYSLKKEKWVMAVLVIQSVISFVSYWFSIPYFGYWGAMYVKITLEFVNTTLSGIFLVYALKNQK